MESMKDSALPQLNSKAAKSYFANLATILSCTINITAPFSDCQVYVSRPSSLNSFTNSTRELIFDSVKFDEDNLEGFEHCYGGKLVTFLSTEAVSTFASQFPVDIVVGKKTHHFHLGPPQPSTLVFKFRSWAYLAHFPLSSWSYLASHLHSSQCTWFTTNFCAHAGGSQKGVLIFSVCLFSLLVAKTMALGGYDIQFGFLNRDAHCHLCGHAGHSPDFCHVTHMTKLPTIYFNNLKSLTLPP